MNKIEIVDSNLIANITDESIDYEFAPKDDKLLISSLKLKIKEDTDLELNIEVNTEDKIDIFINILSGVHLNICEYINGIQLKIQNKYYLEKNSHVEIRKINNINSIKEYDIVNLNGEGASFKRVLKTISTSQEKYDMLIYHNALNTNSDVINHGVNMLDGELIFNVSSFVPKDISGCYANQTNRIINLTNNKCQICPNMYIDCFDVIANHSAFIGSFTDEELFYLQSRGIPQNEATKLLLKGFLTSDLEERQKQKYSEILDKYWR